MTVSSSEGTHDFQVMTNGGDFYNYMTARETGPIAMRLQSGEGVVGRDFNAFAGKVELRDFMANLKLASANLSDLPTFPSRAPRWQLDFILHSPEIRVTHFEVARNVRRSDHLPLICDFEIRPPAEAAGA